MNITDVVKLTILFIAFILFIVWLLIFIHSIKLENRLSNYTVKSKKNETISIIDKLLNLYNSFKNSIIERSIENNNISKLEKRKKEIDMTNLINSILSAIIFMIIYIFLSIFYVTKINILSVISVLILGFTLPGILYIVKEHIRKKNIEHNLLRAISIINNSLQANKSIKEAIIDTKDKVEGDIKYELEEVINDLNYGLSLEVAFKRMEERCNVDDIVYLTTALSILNKTGGNTKEVFDYLENLFTTRKKLNQELDATIASSKLVYIILSILPIITLGGMMLLYDNYLYLFIETNIGKLIGASIVLLYMMYIFIIRKIMIIEKY